MTHGATRIILADDHSMIRQAIARALDDVDGFEVVAQAGSAEEALQLIDELVPDIVLMDLTMPGMGGLQAAEILHSRYLQTRVLILTIHDREDYFFKALQAGASGYILKGAELDELVEAIRAVAGGEIYIFPSLMPKLLDDYLHRHQQAGAPTDCIGPLSPREDEVLRLIAAGSTTRDVAEALVLSPHTVRRHRDHIMAKLGLHSQAELIRFAMGKGLLEPLGQP